MITLITFSFIGLSIARNASKLVVLQINFNSYLWILIAIILTIISIFLNAFAWTMLVYSFINRKLKLNLIGLFVSTNLYKYMPGGVWHLIARIKALKLKINLADASSAVLLEPLLMLVAGLFWIPFGGFYSGFSLICFFAPLLLLPRLRIIILTKLNSFKKSKLIISSDVFSSKFELENQKNQLHYPFKALLIEILFVFIRFCGFWCCLNAFSIGSSIAFENLISSFSFAWIVGLIIPAAPGGLGVFETAIMLTMSSSVPEAPFLASLICYRLVSTVADVFSALIFSVKKLLFSIN